MGKFNLLSERLAWAVEQKLNSDPTIRKITKRKIAEVAGVTAPAATHWFADENGMDAEQARRLSAFFNVNAVWLEKGEGNPEISNSQESRPPADGYISGEQISEVVSVFCQTDDIGRQGIMAAIAAAKRRIATSPTTANDKLKGNRGGGGG